MKQEMQRHETVKVKDEDQDDDDWKQRLNDMENNRLMKIWANKD